jgi:hypothetical protein
VFRCAARKSYDTPYRQRASPKTRQSAKRSRRAGYRELSDAANKTAHLVGKAWELIAIAVGVSRHVTAVSPRMSTLPRGATKEDIAEAPGVAIAVNAGRCLSSPRA